LEHTDKINSLDQLGFDLGKGGQYLGKINVSSFEITVQKANMQ